MYLQTRININTNMGPIPNAPPLLDRSMRCAFGHRLCRGLLQRTETLVSCPPNKQHPVEPLCTQPVASRKYLRATFTERKSVFILFSLTRTSAQAILILRKHSRVHTQATPTTRIGWWRGWRAQTTTPQPSDRRTPVAHRTPSIRGLCARNKYLSVPRMHSKPRT